MKITHVFIALAVIAMLASALNAQPVQTGTFKASESTPGYTLAAGSGDRSTGIEVKFDKPFASKPQVILGVTTVDGAKESNLRYEVQADAVTRDGFTVKLKTWGDTKIFTIGGNWLAIEAGKPAPPQGPAAEPPKKVKKGKK
jgi:hypothetical protein